jgi:hypothetical protein
VEVLLIVLAALFIFLAGYCVGEVTTSYRCHKRSPEALEGKQ